MNKKRLFNELFVYENILLAYFSKENSQLRALYNTELENVVKRFLDIYAAEDAQKSTDYINTIRMIYCNPETANRETICRELGMSHSTFMRIRVKFCLTLKMLVSFVF